MKPARRTFGIRAILLLLVLISIAPFFAVVIWASSIEQEGALDDARRELRAQVQSRAASQEQFIQGVHHLLNAIAHAVPPGSQTLDECHRYLSRLQAKFPSYAHLGFADTSGNIVCRSAQDQRPISMADRPHFIGAMRSGQFTVGEYMISRLFGRPAMALTLPVQDDAAGSLRWRGVYYAILDLAVVQRQFAARSALPHMAEMVTDARGRVLASAGNNAAAPGQQLDDALLEVVRTQPAAQGQWRDTGGRDWLYAVQSVRPEGDGRIAVVALVRVDSVLGPAVRRLRWQLAVLLVIAAGASLLAWRVGECLIAAPIQRLLATVRALEHAEAPPVPTGGTVRELAAIGRGLGDLARALAARSAEVERALTEIEQQKTSLQHSEQRYRARFETSPQPMWVYDLETLCFLDVNQAALAHYGYTRDEFMHMTLADIRPAEDVPLLPELLRAGRSSVEKKVVARHRRKNGDIMHVEVAGHVLDWDGRPARAIAIYDVTSQVEADRAWQRLHETLERKVARRTRELARANEELEAFSYSVSHDLRGPVQNIAGFCSAVIDRHGSELSPRARHYLERILAGTVQMNALIGDLLSFARTGREPLAQHRVDLSALAAQVVAALRQQEPQRQVTVRIEDGMAATGDTALLKIVLENLVGNAWKFTGRTAAAVIEVGGGGPPGTFMVADNGAGFDPAYADKLFKPFQRLHSSVEFEGSGVGLAIVHRIVERHGGSIWAESNLPGRGARFFFSLPAPGSADAPTSGVAALA